MPRDKTHWHACTRLPLSHEHLLTYERTNERIAHPQIEGGGRTLAGRLKREMCGLTSMVWDDKYAR